MLFTATAFSQQEKKKIAAQRISKSLKIDGILDEPEWKTTQVADKFTALRPTPFVPENPANKSEVYFLYNDEGLYIGGYFHEDKKDSIASELIGRDGFGNNDFVGVIFDTYNDKINGFEYFVTPLGEQMDAKQAPNQNGNSEDFSWNAVWQSGAKIHNDGWSFEIFLPYSAIRFGKKKVQDWGLNIVRKRQKSGQQLFWQSIDPTANGFLTQEGMLTGLTDIKPPLRLQFSPYFSTYVNHYPYNQADLKNWNTKVNGGMDVKVGLNQAFTLDMTLIPDFGQVQSDKRVLNLTPFEVKYDENRTFFTEGTELFNKGNLFYSRRIGGQPIHYWDVEGGNESIIKNPQQSKLVNATKISGRTQKGLGMGVLNAVTKPQFALIENNNKEQRKIETDPLTNYNVFVLDQTMKHNSSISFVNTNVWRAGKDYDANVSAFLFDLNDKKNKWNVGGSASVSNVLGKDGKNTTGYSHSIYFGKTSGKFNFNISQELYDSKYDKSDLGYFTNNNTIDNSIYMGYSWIKPKKWFNRLRLNFNSYYSRLVTPIDLLKRKEMMYQNGGGNVNMNGQTKKLWFVGTNVNWGYNYNDFYETRVPGRVFKNKGRIGIGVWWNSNESKKLSWGGEVFTGTGGVFNRKSISPTLFGKIRFSSKFSIDNSLSLEFHKNNPGWAAIKYSGAGPLNDTIIFSRRDLRTVENTLGFKYNFNNKMGITLKARHYWSKVSPQQFYELNKFGDMTTPSVPFTKNVNQNYNYLSADLVYTWQFAQGSFINVVWKNIGESFNRDFEKNYFSNLDKTISGSQANSFSIRVIYFLDYLTARKQLAKKK
ncbi:MAG: hypothetical protein RIS73_1805 [Bacteroidota bacterium]|jgi:hypothetical protein